MGNQHPTIMAGLQHHQRLGPVKYLQTYNKQTSQVFQTMQLVRSINHEKNIEKWSLQIQRIDDTQSRQILLLPQKYEFKNDGVCGSSGTVHIIFDSLPYTLTCQITNRFKLYKYFDERQVWYLLYNMIRAANKFQRIHKKVGNIHPDNILINDNGQIKIIACCSLPGELDNYQLVSQNLDAHAFLAPQELNNDAVKNSQYPIHIDPCLAQVFSIGLTILSVGTLLNCQHVYEKRKDSLRFNQQSLKDIFHQFKLKYSPFLNDVVADMININPKNRKASNDIYQILYCYENQILNLQTFNPPQRYIEPPKTHRTGPTLQNAITQKLPEPQIIDFNLKPKIQLGSYKHIINAPIQYSQLKINSQPFIPTISHHKVQNQIILPNNVKKEQFMYKKNIELLYNKQCIFPSTTSIMSPRVKFDKKMPEITWNMKRYNSIQKVSSPIELVQNQIRNPQNINEVRKFHTEKQIALTSHIIIHPPVLLKSPNQKKKSSYSINNKIVQISSSSTKLQNIKTTSTQKTIYNKQSSTNQLKNDK